MRIPYLDLGIDKHLVENEVLRDFDQCAKMQSLRCPALIMHTREDGLVHVDNAQRLAQWAGDKLDALLIFEQGDHNSIQWINQSAYRQELGRFIAQVKRANPCDQNGA
jgi:alpha-beta hydrolase superfamily lysophospholipase